MDFNTLSIVKFGDTESLQEFLFVNGRPVRDKLLGGAVRGAYQDFLARDRHPMVALFLEAPPEMVDVNVHPQKAEVRFADGRAVQEAVYGVLSEQVRRAFDIPQVTRWQRRGCWRRPAARYRPLAVFARTAR